MSIRPTLAAEAAYDTGQVSYTSSLVDRHTAVDGTLSTSEDLRVDGRVAGTVHCEGTLIVSEDAVVDANVDAAGVVVAGTLTGDVVCRGRLEIRPTGIVRATVQTAALVIHEGAVYEGQLRMEAGSGVVDAEPSGEPVAEDTESETPTYPFLRRFDALPTTDEDDLPSAADDASDEDDEP